MKIIVGLGNPGRKYHKTRHNLGFIFLDKLAERQGLKWQSDKKFKAEITKSQAMILVKPNTYMNNSGEAVIKILDYYDLLERDDNGKLLNTNLSETLIVVHDELDIDLGKYKISINSRSAGHNGVQSIINMINTQNFTRLRLGIKTELLEKMPAEKFVLKKLSKLEMEMADQAINEALVNF